MTEREKGTSSPLEKKSSSTTEPLAGYLAMSRIAHLEGDAKQLEWIENQMNGLKVGESFKYNFSSGDEITITKVEQDKWTITYPEDIPA